MLGPYNLVLHKQVKNKSGLVVTQLQTMLQQQHGQNLIKSYKDAINTIERYQ